MAGIQDANSEQQLFSWMDETSRKYTRRNVLPPTNEDLSHVVNHSRSVSRLLPDAVVGDSEIRAVALTMTRIPRSPVACAVPTALAIQLLRG